VSAYDLLSQGNTFYKLQTLPQYTKYVSAPMKNKQAAIYGLYARPIIPWSLACEENGKTRQDMHDIISLTPPADLGYLTEVVSGATLVLVFTIICCCINGLVNLLPKEANLKCCVLIFYCLQAAC
jgi:hypothetical protein